jgi:hypothetical protein
VTFVAGQAVEVTETKSMKVYSRVLRGKGHRIVLVCLKNGFHAGHRALVRAAHRIPGSVVVVAAQPSIPQDVLAEEKVDLVFRYTEESLWPNGRRIGLQLLGQSLEPAAALEAELSLILAVLGAVNPTDVLIGERDYELSLNLNRMVADFQLGVTVHSHPTVRSNNGVAVATNQCDQAVAMAAALLAGAHAAANGKEAVLAAAREVLAAANITPEYLELRTPTLDDALTPADARLMIAVDFDGTRLIDNVQI